MATNSKSNSNAKPNAENLENAKDEVLKERAQSVLDLANYFEKSKTKNNEIPRSESLKLSTKKKPLNRISCLAIPLLKKADHEVIEDTKTIKFNIVEEKLENVTKDEIILENNKMAEKNIEIKEDKAQANNNEGIVEQNIIAMDTDLVEEDFDFEIDYLFLEEDEDKNEDTSTIVEDENKLLLNYLMLENLYNSDLIENSEPFKCDICLDDEVQPNDGVILKDCLHMFCKYWKN